MDGIWCVFYKFRIPNSHIYAENLGFVIKLLAIAEANQNYNFLQVKVHLTLLPKDHPLANVDDVYNAILVEGEPRLFILRFN